MIAIGYNNITNTGFKIEFDEDLAMILMEETEKGNDKDVDTVLEFIGNRTPLARVLDAFTWIDFTDEAIMLLAEGKRFAIQSDDVAFGVGANAVEARNALDNQEF